MNRLRGHHRREASGLLRRISGLSVAARLAIVGITLSALPVPAQSCIGDCDGSGQVTVDEILRAVSIALGAARASECTRADDNGDGVVTVDEIVNAVTAALRGCSITPGVCGGAVTSTPKICNVQLIPDPVLEAAAVFIRVSVADLEGNVNQLCLGYAPVGTTPSLQCEEIEPGIGTINGTYDFGPFDPPAPGTYSGILRFIDSTGNHSNDLTTDFVVVPILYLYGGSDLRTFLGCLTCLASDPDSVFNDFGTYGSSFSATSIRNPFGAYGSAFSNTSACNTLASDPPGVFDVNGVFLGRLTSNPLHPQALRDPASLYLVSSICGP